MQKILNIELKPFSMATNESVPHPLMISSHERSGTHFLINSISLNSEFTNKPLIHFDNTFLGALLNFHSAKSLTNFFRHLVEKKCSSIVKNHFASKFFIDEATDRFILENMKIIYIARDPFYALASYCRFVNSLSMKEGPRINNLMAFIKSEPCWNMTRYQYSQHRTITERWANHVLGWYSLSLKHKNIEFVTYQDLDKNYPATMKKIFAFLQLPVNSKFERPDATKNVVHISNANQIAVDDEKAVRFEIWKLLTNLDVQLLKRILKME